MIASVWSARPVGDAQSVSLGRGPSSARSARAHGCQGLRFAAGTIADAPLGRVDILLALHACDTATDDAIDFALAREAQHLVLVPCCQAEVSRLLDEAKGPLHQLWRHPIQRREFGAHVTNVIRGLYLESLGYKVRVTEFTGLEHTMKNELILAERHQRSNAQARAELDRLIGQLGIKPGLLDALP